MSSTFQNPMSTGSLAAALRTLGRSEATREGFIALLREYEREAPVGGGVNLREEVTGPILDAIIGPGEMITKELSSGLKMSAAYTSKIVRDFVMAADARPDHVWEPQTTRTLLALTKGAKNVVIGGAYFGDHAVPIADQMRGEGLVHCFELSPQNAGLLQRNAEQNGLDNIRVNTIGLWSESNVRLTLSGADSHAAPSVADADATDAFPATTIDAYAESAGIAKVDLIMLDIEGGEIEALKGARRALSLPSGEAPIVVFELHSSYVDWSNGLARTDIVELLTGHGYTTYAIRDYHSNVPMTGKPIELVELEGAYLEGPAHGFNMLAVKDDAALDPALFHKRRGVSPKLLAHRDPKLHAPLS